MADGIMDYNWLGVAFVDEDLPNYKKIEELINKKTEQLRDKAMQEFDKFLDELGLEQVMGVIVEKGSVK